MKINDRLPEPEYLSLDPELPDMGRSGLGPRACQSADVDAILACDDLVALAQMRGYARSYFATAGGIVLGGIGTIAGAVMQRPRLALVGALVAGSAALVTIEARRRARQWESVIETAIARVTAHAATNSYT